MWGAPLYAGGLQEAFVCGVLSGFGVSVLVFFGERGPVAVGHGAGPVPPEWSGLGRLGDGWLGAWRRERAELGRLLGAGPSV